MNNLIRFTGIVVVLVVASLLVLAVGGVLSSSALWHSVLKVVELAGILCVCAAAILFLSKR
jgi:hypothetical protein